MPGNPLAYGRDAARRSSLSQDAPTAAARAEAAGVVAERMERLRYSAADLHALSGLSVNTIRDITEETGNPNRSTWVAASAVLGLPWDYLVNILDGRPDRNAVTSPLEIHLAKLAEQFAEIGALRDDVAGLTDIVQEINGKLGGSGHD